MVDGNTEDHRLRVNGWLARARALPSAADLCQAFEFVFGAIWRRALGTLGEVTLGAIIERVRYNATEKLPAFAALRVGPDGLHCEGLAERPGVSEAELADALGFILVEFLSVVGNLTAEILTPALHAALARATRELPAPGRTPSGRDEDKEPQ